MNPVVEDETPYHETAKAKKERWNHFGLFVIGIMTPVAGILAATSTSCDESISASFSAYLILFGMTGLGKSAIMFYYLIPFDQKKQRLNHLPTKLASGLGVLQLIVAIWGCAITWPKASDGFGGKLNDCSSFFWFCGFFSCTITIGFVALIVLGKVVCK